MISIYKFDNEDDAKLAVKACNDYYGYPKEGCLSLTWCDYNYSEVGNFYYIEYGDTLNVVLGQPIEFNINDL